MTQLFGLLRWPICVTYLQRKEWVDWCSCCSADRGCSDCWTCWMDCRCGGWLGSCPNSDGLHPAHTRPLAARPRTKCWLKGTFPIVFRCTFTIYQINYVHDKVCLRCVLMTVSWNLCRKKCRLLPKSWPSCLKSWWQHIDIRLCLICSVR